MSETAEASGAAAGVADTAAIAPAGTGASATRTASAGVPATGGADSPEDSAAWARAPLVRSGTSLMNSVTRKPSSAIGATYRKMSAMPCP